MKKLLEQPSKYAARGVVRNDKAAEQLRGWGASDEQIFKGDILSEDGKQVLPKAVEGTDALVSSWAGGWLHTVSGLLLVALSAPLSAVLAFGASNFCWSKHSA